MIKRFRISNEARVRLESREWLIKSDNGLCPLIIYTFMPLVRWLGWMDEEGEVILKENAGQLDLVSFAEELLANQTQMAATEAAA